MSQPGHTPQSGDAAYIAQQGFHAPSFGEDDFDLNTFAMTTEADQGKTMIAQQQQHQQQLQMQQQQMHQQQQQQQQQATRTHIYISAPGGHGQQSVGGRSLHIISNPGTVTQHNMNVAGCLPGMATDDNLAPKFPPQNFDVPDIILSNSVTASEAGMPVGMTSGVTSSMAAMTSVGMTSSMYPGGEAVSCVQSGVSQQPVNRVYYTNVISATGVPQMHGRILSPGQQQQTQGVPAGMYSLLQRQQQLQLQQQQQQQLHHQPHLQQQQQQMTALGSGQMGFQTALHSSVSPAGSSHSSSPRRESSEDSDDCLPLAQLVTMKRAATDVPMATDTIPMTTAVTGDAQTPPVILSRVGEGGAGGSLSPAKKQKATKKKKKKDPNEPQKPVSAYALFFRDTQAAIKGQNPSASFGEVSKIVASMWDGLDPAHKEVYKKKTELAKKEYLKQLAAYRASQVSQSAVEEANASSEKSPSPPSVQPMSISVTPVPNATTITHSYADMQAMQQQMQQQQMQQQQLQQQQMQQQQLQHHQYTAPETQMEVTPTFHTLTPTTSTTDPIIPAIDNGLFPQSAMQESPSNINMMCVRDGCGNLAIENPGWDAEYCSNECVVTHCRDIFTAWVASRGTSSYPVK